MRHLLLLLSLLILTACQEELPPPPPATQSVATTALPVHLGLAEGSSPWLAAQLEGFRAGGAPFALVEGSQSALQADLDHFVIEAFISHQVPAGDQYWFNPIAVDGLVILTHPDNPIAGLTLSQVQAIFSGALTNWQDAGGNDAPITLIGRPAETNTHQLFRQRVLSELRLGITAEIAATDSDLRQVVAANPAAVGYSMMGAAGVELVRTLAIETISPTPQTTADQTYPLSIPFYFIALAEPTGPERALLAWLQSDAGQRQLSDHYGRVR